MSSDLARQIARAAVEAPIAGHVKAAKHGGRASFLYDGVTALEIDIKTSHEVGLNGDSPDSLLLFSMAKPDND